MLKALLILFLICLLISYLGYRALRFFSRVARVVSGIHEEGQARGPITGDSPDDKSAAGRRANRSAEEFQNAYGPRGYRVRNTARPESPAHSRPGGEKDITSRSRIVE